MGPLILSLCDYSGTWSRPYARRGYEVVMVDISHPVGERRVSSNLWTVGADVRDYEFPWQPHGVLAAPPCTCFCRPAARWWKRQDEAGETAENIEVLRACLSLCRTAAAWWALENPPGRHRQLIPELGKPSWQFQPWEYGDPWGKQTYIWGTASKPRVLAPVQPAPTRRTPNGKTQGRIAFMSGSWKRQREQTPRGFAEAFCKANA